MPRTSYSDMRIGYSRVNAGYFNGIIDEVRLYRRALSDQEIQKSIITHIPIITPSSMSFHKGILLYFHDAFFILSLLWCSI